MLGDSAFDSSIQNSQFFPKQPILSKIAIFFPQNIQFFSKTSSLGSRRSHPMKGFHCFCAGVRFITKMGQTPSGSQGRLSPEAEFQGNWINPCVPGCETLKRSGERQMSRAGGDFHRRWALEKLHKRVWAPLVGMLGCPGQRQHSLVLVERILPAQKIPDPVRRLIPEHALGSCSRG